ncbi:MAG: PKD domain-containing protein [Candidatus Nanopelagicales bacterium]
MWIRVNPRGILASTALSLTLVLVGSQVVAADQGDPDPIFGFNGSVVLSINPFGESPKMAAGSSDGGLFVAGITYPTVASSSVRGFVVKFTGQGAVDPSFGDDGIVQIDLGGEAELNALAVQPDGGVVVGGRTAGLHMLVARFTPAGDLDLTFDGDGMVTPDFGGTSESVDALAVTDGGDIVAVGSTWSAATGWDTTVLRLDANGGADTGFGVGGGFITDCGFEDLLGRDLALTEAGSVTVIGGIDPVNSSRNTGCLFKLDANGVLDPSFGSAGVVAATVGAFESLVRQSDGRLVIAGVRDNTNKVMRYTAAGAVDPSFGAGGTTVLDVGAYPPPRLAIQADDRIIILTAGVWSSGPMNLWRLTRDGANDTDYLSGLYLPGGSPIRLHGNSENSALSPADVLATAAGIVAVGQMDFIAPPYLSRRIFAARIVNSGVRNDPVTASLTASPSVVVEGQPVALDASTSTTASGTKTFRWDLDDNGTFETNTGSVPTALAAWPTPGTARFSVRVTSGSGNTATASTQVAVTPNPPGGDVGVSINNADPYTRTKNVSLAIVWPEHATSMRISNDGGFRDGQTLDVVDRVPWVLDDTVTGKFTKVVYLRFAGPGIDESQTYSDDIILDTDAPIVTQASAFIADRGTQTTALGAAKMSPRAKRVKYRVHVKARDKLSGVQTVRVNTRKSTTRSLKRPYHRRLRLALPVRKKIYVKVRDGAGNWTKWKKVVVRKR